MSQKLVASCQNADRRGCKMETKASSLRYVHNIVINLGRDMQLWKQTMRRPALRNSPFLLATLVFTVCQSSDLTQKEIFELRSECAALAAKQSTQGSVTPPGILYTYRGHYDSNRNRCLLKGMTMIFADRTSTHITTIKSLSDAQSGSCEINGDPVAKEKAEQDIDERMGDDK